MQVQLTTDQRRKIILDAGVKLAADNGLCAVRHVDVAEACSVQTSVATVRWYYRTNSELWTAVAAASDLTRVRDEAKALGLL